MTPGDIVLGILAASGVVGLVTVSIAMSKAKAHVVGIVKEGPKDERPASVDRT